MMGQRETQEPVYVVDGCRTPYLKARGVPGKFTASDLAVQAGKTLLTRQDWARSAIGEVILGCIMPRPTEVNIARVVGLRLGLDESIPAWTVQRNCASGMQAIDNAMNDIRSGRHEVVLAGGTEAMSHAPLLFNDDMVKWFSGFMGAKTFSQKLKSLAGFRLGYLNPTIALICGLTDWVVDLNMGQTAEVLAKQFNISRLQMDEFSVQSHLRVVQAYAQQRMQEVIPLYGQDGIIYRQDDGFRADSSVEKLAKLKPAFDKKYGLVTPGNSSQVTDGAALLLLASAKAVKKYDLKILGSIIDCQWAALDPRLMGLGPIHAATPLLQKHNLTPADIDYWEVNEAFAAQVLACQAAWKDDQYCRDVLGLTQAFGELPTDRLNIDGGGIALGHPVGSSGARIVLHLLHILNRQKAKRGVASICIGGGQGGAMLIQPAMNGAVS